MTAPELETWKSAIHGMVVLRKFGVAGNIIEEQVQAHRTVHVTPQERRLNQEVAASDDLDVFKNGMLVPVILVDSDQDTKELKANVNAMSETNMKALFNHQAPAFRDKIKEISNPSALSRLIEIAHDVDATVKQVETIQARLSEVSPQISEVSTGTQVIGGAAIGTKAPKGSKEGMPMGVTPR